jgi:hypothetical protein
MALLLTVVPLWGSWRGAYAAMRLAPSLAAGRDRVLRLSFACLATAFLQDDFSVGGGGQQQQPAAADLQVLGGLGQPRGLPAAVGADPVGFWLAAWRPSAAVCPR